MVRSDRRAEAAPTLLFHGRCQDNVPVGDGTVISLQVNGTRLRFIGIEGSPRDSGDLLVVVQIGSGGESGSRLSLPRERLPLGFSGAFQSWARGMPFQFETAAAEVNPMAVRRHPLHRSGMPTTRLEAAFETVFDLLQLKLQRIPCISLRRRDIPIAHICVLR